MFTTLSSLWRSVLSITFFFAALLCFVAGSAHAQASYGKGKIVYGVLGPMGPGNQGKTFESPVAACLALDPDYFDVSGFFYYDLFTRVKKTSDSTFACFSRADGDDPNDSSYVASANYTGGRTYCKVPGDDTAYLIGSDEAVRNCLAPCPDDCLVGNPMSVTSATKFERHEDWRSRIDPRFFIARQYSSSQAGTAYVEKLRQPLAGGWVGSWEFYMKKSTLGDDDRRIFTPTARRLVTDHVGSLCGGSTADYLAEPDFGYSFRCARLADDPYSPDRSPLETTHRLSYKDGTRFEFLLHSSAKEDPIFLETNGSSGYPTREISRILFTDGYEINYVYSDETEELISIEDTKGQRAEFYYTASDSDTNHRLLSSIQIDTDYDAGSGIFSPEVKLDYQYEVVWRTGFERLPNGSDRNVALFTYSNASGTGSIFGMQAVSYAATEQALTRASISDLTLGTTEILWDYEYHENHFDLIVTAEHWKIYTPQRIVALSGTPLKAPLLKSVRRGDASGQLSLKGTYEYYFDYYAARSSGPGGVGRTDLSLPYRLVQSIPEFPSVGFTTTEITTSSSNIDYSIPVSYTAYTIDVEPRIPTATNAAGLKTTFTREELNQKSRLSGVTTQAFSNNPEATVSLDYVGIYADNHQTGSIRTELRHYVERITNRNSSQTLYARDYNGRPVSIVEDEGSSDERTTTLTYRAEEPAYSRGYAEDLEQLKSRETSSMREEFEYIDVGLIDWPNPWVEDPHGLLYRYRQIDNLTQSPNRVWEYTYSEPVGGTALRLIQKVDGPGRPEDGVFDITTYEYDTFSRLQKIRVNVLGQGLVSESEDGDLITEILSRDRFGNPDLIRGPNQTEWQFEYDMRGRLLESRRDPTGDNATVTYTYDGFDNIRTMTDTRGNTWTYDYDAAQRLTLVTDPLGSQIAYSYDALSNVTRTEYRKSNGTIAFSEAEDFDALSRLVETVRGADPSANVWSYQYDVEDNLIVTTDPQARTITNTFDALNRITKVRDENNKPSDYTLNETGQMTKFTDARQIETEFVYNGFGEVIREISADRGTRDYTYNNRGLVSSMTDPRGITTEYLYDNSGRLISKSFGENHPENVTLSYDRIFAGNTDSVGRLTDVTDQSGTTRTKYRSKGTVQWQEQEVDNFVYRVTYNHDDNGNLTFMRYPSGRETVMLYDAANQLNRLRMRPVQGAVLEDVLTGVNYHPFGPMKEATLNDGSALTEDYDQSYRLIRQQDLGPIAALRDITYGYDSRDDLTSVTNALDPSNSETFTYGSRPFLNVARGPYGKIDYDYNEIRDRTRKETTVDGIVETETYLYPALSNRLSQINRTTGVARRFTYDAAGNVTCSAIGNVNCEGTNADGDYSYTYNAAGRMETVSKDQVLQARYTYNHLGQQVKREIASGIVTPGVIDLVIHNVFDLDGNRIAEYEVGGTAGPQLLREYIWHDGVPIAVVENGQTYYIRTDHIGRPVFATDSTGAKVWEVSYLPFGGVHTTSGLASENRFPGQWFQAESGLHQNWMRDYDPTTGRYLQADPLGLIDGASVYGYARQSPLRYTDPTGECPWCYALGGAGLAGGANLWYQLETNNWDFQCVNWTEVGLYAAAGAFGGGFVGHARKGLPVLTRLRDATARSKFRKAYGITGRGTEVGHALFPARGLNGARIKGPSWRHHPMNFRATPTSVNRRFLGKWKRKPRFKPWQKVAYGIAYAPEWAIVAGGSIGAGTVVELAD